VQEKAESFPRCIEKLLDKATERHLLLILSRKGAEMADEFEVMKTFSEMMSSMEDEAAQSRVLGGPAYGLVLHLRTGRALPRA
jgi:hypothetical protein